MIEAKIIADSIGPQGDRLTTFVVTYPRIIHSEVMTHRMFSRNSASSRAIPFAKTVESVKENPFIPIAWMKDHKGMQGTEYLSEVPSKVSDKDFAIDMWLEARDAAVNNAKILNDTGITKQLCNRLLEPFMWHTVIITSGKEGLENFFNLRCPEYVVSWYPSDRPEALEPTQGSFKSRKDAIARTEGECDNWTEEDWRNSNISQAEIHIQALAEAMWDAMNKSTPEPLVAGMWHIPFMSKIDSSKLESVAGVDVSQEMIKIATARCARVSYTVVGEEGKPSNYANDIKLHDRLVESGHWSPFEHVARVMSDNEYQSWYSGKGANENHTGILKNQGWCRNFKGFIQYRELIS